MFDIDKIKKDFPYLLQENAYVYLDTAATSLKPKSVIDSLNHFYKNEYATVHRGIYAPSKKATIRYDETRNKLKSFINAKSSNEIVFTKGATDSINLVALSFGKKNISQSDEIIIIETEHHSNIVPWQMLCKEKNAILKVAKVNENAEIDIDYFKTLLSDKTKLVCIAHMANSTGIIHPVKEIIKEVRSKTSALVLVDGAQAIAHQKVDVQDLDSDFYVFSSHKMYGPTGVGVLYAKEDILEMMPPIQGGGDMIETVSFNQETTYQKAPLKFEAGTPNIAAIIAFKDAMDYLETIGMDNIYKREKELLNYATSKLKEIKNLKIIGDSKNKGSVISFIIKDLHPMDVATFLDMKKIAIRTGHHCAQPTMQRFNVESTLRISFGIYTTFEDIDYFINSLKEVIAKLST
ncbi:MAG: Cysteine desulfurase [Candidatus Anoxychlamydiales bacterium]|nr:Cysteine desulfurase [Candidatus Anoxychlamydiales bacterium]